MLRSIATVANVSKWWFLEIDTHFEELCYKNEKKRDYENFPRDIKRLQKISNYSNFFSNFVVRVSQNVISIYKNNRYSSTTSSSFDIRQNMRQWSFFGNWYRSGWMHAYMLTVSDRERSIILSSGSGPPRGADTVMIFLCFPPNYPKNTFLNFFWHFSDRETRFFDLKL